VPPTRWTEVLTIATVRKSRGRRPTQFLFNERQLIFELRSPTKGATTDARLLRRAFDREEAVRVTLDDRNGLIRRVVAASPKEFAELRVQRPLLDSPDRVETIAVDEIDPTQFNIVDHHLKFDTFKLCDEIVPDYKTAKDIFDYCAAQSCHLPDPPGITPCIPFQYVRDGCFARAHKMRQIIETKYGYCCEKVFSFANQNQDRLSVRADKWGGCCVTWWYHVAPLIRVQVRILQERFALALVVDPGMFDKPVLLSTWLSAQKNPGCDLHANVSMYSIQPGSAYTPANYAGTAFTTDPAYTATDATLVAYSTFTTCP
jgi:hypothetical protein